MRIAMTGGGGFIGAHVLARMVGAGMDVTLLGPDTGRSRYTASLVARGRVRLLRCDEGFRADDALRGALADTDALVLLGYAMPTGPSPAQRLGDEIARNLTPLLRLLRAAEAARPHVVFASSVAVYGHSEEGPVDEHRPPRPVTSYAVGKLACEQAVRVWCADVGTTAAILRYAAVYGPGEPMSRQIPGFIAAALTGRAVVVDGDGKDENDYVHVADAVDATILALERRADGTYNVGTGVPTTTVDLARLVVRIAGASGEPVCGAEALPVERARLICDTTRARGDLGFSGHRALSDGICEEIGWFRAEHAAPARTSMVCVAG
jgi:UDP-glucose 4-epimerase